MAGTDGPDPREFGSCEDAFKHSIPAVRGMEKKLRTGANENQEKLKTLVGVSYRDLLGTAYTIVDANSQIQTVESLLVNVGRRCDSRILSKIASNHQQLQSGSSHSSSKNQQQTSRAAQLLLLQQCLKVVARLLRARASTLLTAKLLVVARLLYKILSSTLDQSPINNLFGKRMASLRAQLLRHIDRRFEKPYTELTDLARDMTAFSLATSSGPSDVLRHYQYIRLEAIKKPMRQENRSFKNSVINNFQLYLGTQREIRTVYPNLLQGSLRNLGIRPLLEDPELWEIDELRLDSQLPWLPPEIRHFTPWTRYEEADRSKLTQALESWSNAGLNAFVSQLSRDIGQESNAEILVSLRTDLLQLWLTDHRHASGINPRKVLTQLQTPFTARIKDLIGSSFSNLLTTVTERISASLGDMDDSDQTVNSLWDSTTLATSISNGALSLRESVVNRRSGRLENIQRVLHAYQEGVKDIEGFPPVIQQMRDVRWDDDDDFSDSEENNDSNNTTIFQLLSREDPAELQKSMRLSATSFINQLEGFFSTLATDENLDCSKPTSSGPYVLRTIRELRRSIPQLLLVIDNDSAYRLICSDIIVDLYTRLAQPVSTATESVFKTKLDAYVNSRRNPTSLWEGSSPPLPIQITPATFQTLRTAMKEMEALGSDLWTPAVAKVLRESLAHSFSQTLLDTIEKLKGLITLPSVKKPNTPPISDDSREKTIETSEPERPEADRTPQSSKSNDQEPSNANKDEPEQISKPESSSELTGLDEAALESQIKEKLIQLLFDTLYLANALSNPPSTAATPSSQKDETAPQQLHNELAERTVKLLVTNTGIDDAAFARLQKSAADYWRKTYLLFGLLCG